MSSQEKPKMKLPLYKELRAYFAGFNIDMNQTKLDSFLQYREIDIRVAEEVMGWKRGEIGFSWDLPDGDYAKKLDDVPHYSQNLESAWEVVEKTGLFFNEEGGAYNELWQEGDKEWCIGCFEHGPTVIRNKSLPLAICLAALKVAEDK